MKHQQIIDQTVDYVKETLADAEGGHDWFHIQRVWNTARKIAEKEQVDLLVVELGALLHDIADSKFHGGDEEVGPRKAREFMQEIGVDEQVIEHVENIIRYVSFKNELEGVTFTSNELKVVQDADRLDAIGAIGIGRAFSFGGHKNRPMHDPEVAPVEKMDKTTYKKRSSPTINHFYEKLLLLKDLMKTNTGRKMAEQRHAYMEEFLKQFLAEWEGEA